ncbi:MAG: hypothetical protein ACPGUC_03960 [Gammaproteobacteria bacterium]
MELKLDTDQFEDLQTAFIEEIVRTISVKLQEGGMQGQAMEEMTANIAFSIASIIDDTSMIEVDGTSVKPYLGFRDDDDNIVHCGENAYTYEFVIPILKKLFDV